MTAPGGSRERLSLPEARRIAIAAQGLSDPRPPAFTATIRDVQRVIDRVGVVQIDSVNVLTRSHYLPFFSRLGPYDRSLVDRSRDRSPRRLVEYWAHEASLIPPTTWPLLRDRMGAVDREAWGSMVRAMRETPHLVDAVVAEVTERGPATARQVEAALAHDAPRRTDHWGWNWSDVKRVLEYLFWAGRISSAGRTSQFERRYASLERVAGSRHRATWLAEPSSEDAAAHHVELMRIAARSLGVASEQCLADYFRMRAATARPAIAGLVESGELIRVDVDGWAGRTYRWAAARRPRHVHAEALVSPFDSLVWNRRRVEALWGFRYRIEIYTPADRRVHGYYVLPFLFGEDLVARCDLKADRTAGVLRQRTTWEPGAPHEAGPALERELASMAGWLGLDAVSPFVSS